jgi:hypothetical protein
MKTSLLKTIRQPDGDKKSGKLNYKLVTFSVCFVLSIALWLMNMLSKKYTESLTFYIKYQHLPTDKKVYPSSDTIHVKVSSSGFRLMAYKLGINDPTLKIDVSSFHHNMYSLTNHNHTEKLEEQLTEDVKVIDISPDTLYLRNEPISSQDQN